MKKSLAFLACALIGATACVSTTQAPTTDLGIANDLTPGTKGERLTPGTKGERLIGEIRGQIALSGKTVPITKTTVRIDNRHFQTTADSQGQFSLQNLPLDQDLPILAETFFEDGSSLKARKLVRLTADAPLLNLQSLLLKQTGNLIGQVSVPANLTAAGVDVYIPGTRLVAKTDEKGHFALTDIPQGDYQLQVYKAGLKLGQTTTFGVQPGQTQTVPLIELQNADSSESLTGLSGQIVDSSQPVLGAQVALMGEPPLPTRLTVSDIHGNFILRVPPGKYTLLITKAFHETLLTEVDLTVPYPDSLYNLPSQALTLGRLQVQVQDCEGQPVSSAVVQLDPPYVSAGITDATGISRLSGVLPGKYTLTAAKGLRKTVQAVNVPNKSVGSDHQTGALIQTSVSVECP